MSKNTLMTFEEAVHQRCSIRLYKDKAIDSEKVKDCIKLATLSPNSSNMQLWEFHHITNREVMQKFIPACFNQNAAKTAQQFVVFVTRQDLAKQRAEKVMQLEIDNVKQNSPQEKQAKRIKKLQKYYGKTLPFLYSRCFGLMGLVRYIFVKTLGLFRPVFQEVTENSNRVMAHKSCALAAQTFMLAMADKGYDTCPMEGYDSRKIKRILNLPRGAEVNMIISCGTRQDCNHGTRRRLAFDEVYRKVE